jgi:glyceraldehyde 3-phosphate dehydrogenase
MAVKVGINGFGRIGRNVYRAAHTLGAEFEIVAVNDIGDARTFAHLLKHDTALGTFGPEVKADGDHILVDGRQVRFLSEKDPASSPTPRRRRSTATGAARARSSSRRPPPTRITPS